MSCHAPASAPVAGRSGTTTLASPSVTLRVLLVGGPNVGKSTLLTPSPVHGSTPRTHRARPSS
jgi:GTPase SAR1 family protein